MARLAINKMHKTLLETDLFYEDIISPLSDDSTKALHELLKENESVKPTDLVGEVLSGDYLMRDGLGFNALEYAAYREHEEVVTEGLHEMREQLDAIAAAPGSNVVDIEEYLPASKAATPPR